MPEFHDMRRRGENPLLLMLKMLDAPLRSFCIPAVSAIENTDEPSSGLGMTAIVSLFLAYLMQNLYKVYAHVQCRAMATDALL